MTDGDATTTITEQFQQLHHDIADVHRDITALDAASQRLEDQVDALLNTVLALGYRRYNVA